MPEPCWRFPLGCTVFATCEIAGRFPRWIRVRLFFSPGAEFYILRAPGHRNFAHPSPARTNCRVNGVKPYDCTLCALTDRMILHAEPVVGELKVELHGGNLPSLDPGQKRTVNTENPLTKARLRWLAGLPGLSPAPANAESKRRGLISVNRRRELHYSRKGHRFSSP